MCVSWCVCMFLCLYVCVSAYLCMFMSVCMPVCFSLCVCVCEGAVCFVQSTYLLASDFLFSYLFFSYSLIFLIFLNWIGKKLLLYKYIHSYKRAQQHHCYFYHSTTTSITIIISLIVFVVIFQYRYEFSQIHISSI